MEPRRRRGLAAGYNIQFDICRVGRAASDLNNSSRRNGQRKTPSRATGIFLYNANIRVATAARLSATYPYVSPATRPYYDGASPVFPNRPADYDHLHAVDGGYFDNSGLCAVTEWLNKVLEEKVAAHGQPSAREQILVLEIRGFPEGLVTQFKTNRGWFYQLYAPLSTLLGVWTSGQAATNVIEFDLLQKYWAARELYFNPTLRFIPKLEMKASEAFCPCRGISAEMTRSSYKKHGNTSASTRQIAKRCSTLSENLSESEE